MQSDISRQGTMGGPSDTVQGDQAGTPGEVLGPRTPSGPGVGAAGTFGSSGSSASSPGFSGTSSNAGGNSGGNAGGTGSGTSSGSASGGPEVPSLDQAKQQAQQVVQQAQQAAGQVAGQVRDQLQARLTSEKDRAVEGLEIVGESLRSTGQKLHEHGQPMLSEYAMTAAESVEGLSGYLKNRDLGQIGREVEDFARSRPVLFLGAIFAVGVVSARFFKSTAQPQLPPGSSQGAIPNSSGVYSGTRTREPNPEISTYVREHNAAEVDAGREA